MTTTSWPAYQSTTSATVCNIWVEWTANTTATTTTCHYQHGWLQANTQQAWTAWQPAYQPRQRQGALVELSGAERAELKWVTERRELIAANRRRAQRLRLRIAERRAEALLLECLDDVQREAWLANHGFTVHTASGAEYFIRRGRAGNVYRVGGARYCMHVSEMVPDADNVLAQKLLLETDEEEFLRLANLA